MFHVANCRSILAVLVWSLLSFADPSQARASDVRFNATGESLQGAALTEEGRLVGFVGDVIELRNGRHRINVAAPQDYNLVLTLRIVDRRVDVVETQREPKKCKPELHVDWSKPRIQASPMPTGITDVFLSEPRFGEPTGRTLGCMMPALARCNPRKVILEAMSEPDGAEIWIDSEKQRYRTNTTLSVPYCDYETTKKILLRIPERVNCQRDIELAPDARIELTCLLREVSAETLADEEPEPNNGQVPDPEAIIVPIPSGADEE